MIRVRYVDKNLPDLAWPHEHGDVYVMQQTIWAMSWDYGTFRPP